MNPLPLAAPTPVLSFAVPVRNAARFVPRLFESLRAQSYPHFEVVICDNASEDDTPAIALSFARADARFRYHRNEKDIGQIANFNRALELSRGRYVRWIGSDDWLEASYAARCIEVLERAPHAVGVTTYQDHVKDDGTRQYVEFRGERIDSPRADVRFRRMLWFFRADYRFIDPIYSMMRRSAVAGTHRLRIVPNMDRLLAAELAIVGPFLHVPECLAHRRRVITPACHLRPRYSPDSPEALETWRLFTHTIPAMWQTLDRVHLGWSQRLVCAVALARFGASSAYAALAPRARRVARRALDSILPPSVLTQRSNP